MDLTPLDVAGAMEDLLSFESQHLAYTAQHSSADLLPIASLTGIDPTISSTGPCVIPRRLRWQLMVLPDGPIVKAGQLGLRPGN